MRIYISGKITGNPTYEIQFQEAEAKLRAQGYDVITPAGLSALMPDDATHAEYMEVCLKLLALADGIYMLPGWEDSKGAGMEHRFAMENGLRFL